MMSLEGTRLFLPFGSLEASDAVEAKIEAEALRATSRLGQWGERLFGVRYRAVAMWRDEAGNDWRQELAGPAARRVFRGKDPHQVLEEAGVALLKYHQFGRQHCAHCGRLNEGLPKPECLTPGYVNPRTRGAAGRPRAFGLGFFACVARFERVAEMHLGHREDWPGLKVDLRSETRALWDALPEDDRGYEEAVVLYKQVIKERTGIVIHDPVPEFRVW